MVKIVTCTPDTRVHGERYAELNRQLLDAVDNRDAERIAEIRDEMEIVKSLIVLAPVGEGSDG